MKKGEIIHKVRDRYGQIKIIDCGKERILSFGKESRQSVILRDTPNTLSLVYTQAMMTALIFQQQPQKALFLGLGGGTMPSFLLHHYPECRVDCVELRQEVVRAAHRYFNLPADEPRLRVIIDDANHFLANTSQGAYDLIFLDLFSESGPAACVQDKHFIATCGNNLSPHGILICNAWTVTEANFIDLTRLARDIFSGQILTLQLAARYNAVIFAFQDSQMPSNLRKRRGDAEQLCQETTINFPSYLRQLIQQNVPLINRLLRKN